MNHVIPPVPLPLSSIFFSYLSLCHNRRLETSTKYILWRRVATNSNLAAWRICSFVDSPPPASSLSPFPPSVGQCLIVGWALSLCFVVSVSQIDYKSSMTRSLSPFVACFMASLALSPLFVIAPSPLGFSHTTPAR